ncbi:MAG TPA: nucleoside diphosphate kinase regulator [Steroidobacteraceae bacterium]|jgi:regulator of nucleoside diphosphate kinase|nr:nucleoside diphosphate kinase regulator [Steroidobacteraceae bacterium]
MEGRIVMSRQDANRLRSLVAAERARRGQSREHLADLEHELDRARVVEGELLPGDRVAVNSAVRVRDLDSGVAHGYTLVWPSQADAAKRRISVLAPMGTALLGCRAGDRVEWQMPGGLVRLLIEEVR